MEFVPLGVIGPTDDEHPAMQTPPVPEPPRSGVTERVGGIEVEHARTSIRCVQRSDRSTTTSLNWITGAMSV